VLDFGLDLRDLLHNLQHLPSPPPRMPQGHPQPRPWATTRLSAAMF
jgi:hypothetical protein